MNQETKKHLSPWIAWSIVALVAGATGFAVWYYWNQIDTLANINITVTTNKKADTDDTKTATNTTTDASVTADWKTFDASGYTFSFKYPTTWTITEQINRPTTNPFGNETKDNFVSITTANSEQIQIMNPVRPHSLMGWSLENKNLTSVTGIKFDRGYGPEEGGKTAPVLYTATSKGITDIDSAEYNKSISITVNSKTPLDSTTVTLLDNFVKTFSYQK